MEIIAAVVGLIAVEIVIMAAITVIIIAVIANLTIVLDTRNLIIMAVD